MNASTTPEALERELERSGQLWIISGISVSTVLRDEHVRLITEFWESGRGLYLCGGNAPPYTDVNPISLKLFGAELTGGVTGDHVVSRRPEGRVDGTGFCDHPIMHGLNNLYEGVVVSSVTRSSSASPALKDVVVGSDGTVVVAAYEADGRRCVIDGGWARLCSKWGSVGTERYVVNAASWLTNVEKFVVPEGAEAPAPVKP
eukprot:m51a1_g10536 hypothetical protein (202) ;mRNA; r:253254-253859